MEYKQLGMHIASASRFVSNFVLWNESGYFDNSGETKPLLHLWSLAIEEQFYIIWPLVLWGAHLRRFNLLAITIAVASYSFFLNIEKSHSDAIYAFFSPQTRFWELLIGSMLAYGNLNKGDETSRSLSNKPNFILRCRNELTGHNTRSALGAFLIILGIFIITKDKEFPGWW